MYAFVVHTYLKIRRSYPINPWLCKLLMVTSPRVSSSLPVSKNTLNPLSINLLNNPNIEGIAGHHPFVAHALNPQGSYGSHLYIF